MSVLILMDSYQYIHLLGYATISCAIRCVYYEERSDKWYISKTNFSSHLLQSTQVILATGNIERISKRQLLLQIEF